MAYKLLFVCLGNICRSPAAENIMNHRVAMVGLGDRIWCDSAGTSSYHIGSQPDQRAVEAARYYGIPLQGRARQLERHDLETFDMILAMDRSNYQDILMLDSQRRFQGKVHLMCDFCTVHLEQEVPDPYYGGPDGFQQMIELLQDGCSGLLRHVQQQLSLQPQGCPVNRIPPSK